MGDTTTTKKAAKAKTGGEDAVLATIAAMSESDRVIGQRVHAVIRAAAPDLAPRTWYGMPAYAKDGKVVCYFRGADKFKESYVTLGFNDSAKLDDGNVWPISYAITKLTDTEETKIAQLVKRAVS
ncbi:MAG: DUF1801 domain-containing protein [Actinomycetota bacterium]|nr:DUF1801 domain-containing protein [Actinomycetota bacterium]